MTSLKLEAKKLQSNESVYDGPVDSGHPGYYGYWTTLRIYCHICSVKLICTKQTPSMFCKVDLYKADTFSIADPVTLYTPKMNNSAIIFYLCKTVHKLDYDQIMSKLR